MKKHKITEELLHAFRALVGRMPQYYFVNHRMMGSELIKSGITMVQGKHVKSDMAYSVPIRTKYDHLKAIEKRYRKGGDAAVQKYCNGIAAKHKTGSFETETGDHSIQTKLSLK